MVNIILAALLTLLVLFFLAQLQKANQTMVMETVISKSWENQFAAQAQAEKRDEFIAKYKKNPDMMPYKKAEKKVKAMNKQIADYTKAAQQYKQGQKLSPLDLVAVFGYRMCTLFKLDIETPMLRKLVRSCELSGYIELERTEETNGKKNAYIYGYYMFSQIIANVYAGLALALFIMIILPFLGYQLKIAAVMGLLAVVVMGVLGYLPLDAISARAKSRTEEIEREFPNAVSKFILLTLAGMNITKALEETAANGDSLIYREFRLMLDEMDRSATFAQALTRMQGRCDNKYLDKMATILAKSYTAGNDNLSNDLLALNAECWLEKKHSARRTQETVQSKLMVPTMLMLISILIMVVVPVMSGFMNM